MSRILTGKLLRFGPCCSLPGCTQDRYLARHGEAAKPLCVVHWRLVPLPVQRAFRLDPASSGAVKRCVRAAMRALGLLTSHDVDKPVGGATLFNSVDLGEGNEWPSCRRET